MKIVFIDTETTGLSAEKQDVVQIAGYVTENRKIYEEFNLRCQPRNWHTISRQALAITHPNKTFDQAIAMLKGFDHPAEVFIQFKAILDKYYDETSPTKFVFAGQNAKFDWRFMSAFWEKNKADDDCEMSKYFYTDVMYDLMDLTKPMKKLGMLDVPNVKLGTIIEALDVKVEGDLHDALTDIEGTYKSFYRMIDEWSKRMDSDNSVLQAHITKGIEHFFENASKP